VRPVQCGEPPGRFARHGRVVPSPSPCPHRLSKPRHEPTAAPQGEPLQRRPGWTARPARADRSALRGCAALCSGSQSTHMSTCGLSSSIMLFKPWPQGHREALADGSTRMSPHFRSIGASVLASLTCLISLTPMTPCRAWQTPVPAQPGPQALAAPPSGRGVTAQLSTNPSTGTPPHLERLPRKSMPFAIPSPALKSPVEGLDLGAGPPVLQASLESPAPAPLLALPRRPRMGAPCPLALFYEVFLTIMPLLVPVSGRQMQPCALGWGASASCRMSSRSGITLVLIGDCMTGNCHGRTTAFS
jgi:hypothetical protein